MPHDDETQGRTLEDYQGLLRRRAKRSLGPRLRGLVDVSGIVQEVFLKAHANRDQVRGKSEGNFLAWLYAILDHTILDVVRKLRRQGGGKTRSLDQRQDDSSSRRIAEPESDGTSPSQKCAKEEERSLLRETMKELPKAQRTAVELRHMEGLKEAEVAERMGISSEAVASLLYRARRTLRKKIGRGTIDGER
jgi:RNA polymerase sigma-70 factor (ECF subfamily)